ncbi:uncharacterized protein LOC141846687 [Curcuma longa]|uniref:uncharacterized protein LOC141846687 n=1 Tax=Curcuma longa TaxID=136217 RepID=UPI003D9EF21B
MVQSSDSGKRRADSTPHSAPPPPAVKLEVDEPLDEKWLPLHKRSRDASTSSQPDLHNNVLGEPGPLGLRLRKSPSLADMIQTRLSQAKAVKTICAISSKSSEVGDNKESMFSASSSSLSKIKASNFPASLLRIGTWECVSRHEGDLVAKCYFAKHKLVWEVLQGGLKSKIEFHWSDITAIKAVFSEGGYWTLDIVLARLPLFFRETDPQPRKHTLWQATQDFTNGQACIHRRHLLQCPQTLLSKNFEKLIDCDPHLKLLSQRPDIILESPYFDPQYSVLEDQSDSKSHINDVIKDDSGTSFSGFYEPGSPCATSSISNKTETRDSFGRTPDFDSQDSPSPCSGIEARSGEENAGKDMETRIQKWWDRLQLPGIRGSMSVTDLVNHLGHHISEQVASGNTSSAASDEQCIVSRVNSLCCLLQKDTVASTTANAPVNDRDGGADDSQAGAGSDDEPYSTPEAELADGIQPPMSRKESFGELLILPRIASMPQFFFNLADDAEKEPR